MSYDSTDQPMHSEDYESEGINARPGDEFPDTASDQRTGVGDSAYLDSISTLASTRYHSTEDLIDGILKLLTEQVGTRSSFLTKIDREGCRYEVLAAYDLPGGADFPPDALPELQQTYCSMIAGSAEPEALTIEDTRADPRVSSHPALTAWPRISSYLGVPVVLSDGTFFGTLCAVDPEPRRFMQHDTDLLIVLGRIVATAIERDRELRERRRAEAELAQALSAQLATNEKLKKINKIRSDFVSVVSHEFRTALTGIQGFSQMIRDENLSVEEMREFAADINEDARRLNRMINEMLDLDRMESGRMTLNVETADLNSIARRVVELTRANAPAHEIRTELDEAVPQLLCDGDKLTQVMTNLLNNAVKYTPGSGQIEVGTRQEGDVAHAWVRDNGIGIPPEALERLFEPYSRVEEEGTRYIKGTGLGLAISREIVRLHGGEIWAESTPGEGSTFHFTLPVVVAPEGAQGRNG